MRHPQTIILEAELLASSPERVYDLLERRAPKIKSALIVEAGDSELELALLARDEPLIELGLAKFCWSHETAMSLMEKANEGNSGKPELRIALLSNTTLQRSVPDSLFNYSEKATFQWLTTCSQEEVAALFANPLVVDYFLMDFFEGKEPWIALDDERRRIAVGAFSSSRLEREYTDIYDPYDEFERETVLWAAWDMVESLPITEPWAYVLMDLSTLLLRERVYAKNALAIASKWHPKSGETVFGNDLEYTQRGLSVWQHVRHRIAMLALESNSSLLYELLESDDPAFRGAAYQAGIKTPKQLLHAFEKEEFLAFDHALSNEHLWMTKIGRETLSSLCRKLERKEEIEAGCFPIRPRWLDEERARMEKKYPQYFSEENVEQNDSEDEKPATKADLQIFADAVKKLEGARERIEEKIPNWFSEDEKPATKADLETIADIIGRSAMASSEAQSQRAAPYIKWIFWFSLAAAIGAWFH